MLCRLCTIVTNDKTISPRNAPTNMVFDVLLRQGCLIGADDKDCFRFFGFFKVNTLLHFHFLKLQATFCNLLSEFVSIGLCLQGGCAQQFSLSFPSCFFRWSSASHPTSKAVVTSVPHDMFIHCMQVC